MKLDNVLEIKAKEYYDKCESIVKNKRTSQDEYDKLQPKLHACETLLNVLDGKTESSFKFDSDYVCAILLEYGYGDVKNNLKNIIVTLNAKKIGLPVELTKEQENELKTYISNLKSLIAQMKEKMSEHKKVISSENEEYDILTEKYIALECLIEKIKDPDNLDILDEDDFQVVYDIVTSSKDLSYTTKSQMLIKFKEYNEERMSSKSKEIESVPYEEVVKFFKDNGLSDGFIKVSKKHKEEIERNINLSSALEILEYMKSVNVNSAHTLLEYFTEPTLLTILVYGNKEYVMQRYEQLSIDGKLYQIFFDTSSVWINNLNKKEIRKTKKNSRRLSGQKTPGTLKYDSQIISYDDMIENERFLQSKGFPVSLTDRTNYKLLKTNPIKIKENYEIYKKYGFFEVAKNSSPSMLGASRLLEKCDLSVEVGILNGIGSNDKDCNLIKYAPTRFLNSDKGFFQYLSYLKLKSRPHEYYGFIVNKERGGGFAKTSISEQMKHVGLGINCTDKQVFDFITENFVDVSQDIPNYEKYAEIVDYSDRIDQDEKVLSLPLIVKLENENKKSRFIYMFKDQIISRFKVLRIASILYEQYHTFNEEMLLFAITKGSYINEEVLKNIESEISYSLGGGMTNGLS